MTANGSPGKPPAEVSKGSSLPEFVDNARATAYGAVSKAPFTVALMGAILLSGLITRSLFRTVGNNRWFEDLAYGLPAFSNGDWLTAITGTFVLGEPGSYLLVMILIPLSVGWLEVFRGTKSAVLTFFLGQFASLAVVAVILLLFRNLGSSWIDELSRDLDTGPNGGIFACLTLAVCYLRQPWKLRWQFLLISFAVVSVTLVGEISDLEHAAAIGLVLLVKFRTISKPNLREQRFIAWVGLLSLVTIQILTIIVPTNGPFGPTQAGGGRIAVIVDALLAIVLSRGLRSGRRVAWVAAIVLAVLNVLRGILGLTLIVTLGPELKQGSGVASFAAAHAALWALMLVYLVVCWRAFGVRRHRRLPNAVGHRGMDPAAVRRPAAEVRRRDHLVDEYVAREPALPIPRWFSGDVPGTHGLRHRPGRAHRPGRGPRWCNDALLFGRRKGRPVPVLLFRQRTACHAARPLACHANRRGHPDRFARAGVCRKEMVGHPHRTQPGRT